MADDSSAGPVTRRRFVAASAVGLAGVVGLGVEGLLLEPRRLSVTSHVLGDPASGGPAIRLAVLTDLHLGSLSDLHRRIADTLRWADADVTVLVGDSIDDAANLPVLEEFLRLLPGTGRRVATLGNWEHWSRVDLPTLRRTYARGETTLLVNEGIELRAGAVLFGTDDSLAGTPSLAGLREDPEGEAVVLSHCPTFRDSIASTRRGIRAVISGHTHGGQVAVAGWAPLRPPGSGPYVAGWYAKGGPPLFVSRGIGTSILPVRLGSVPEVALIDWFPRSG